MKRLLTILFILITLSPAIMRKFDDDRSERWYQGYGNETDGITLTRYNKVGIVTTNPSTELEVVGEIKATTINTTDLEATNLERDLDGTGYDLIIKDINASGTVTAGTLSISELTATTLNVTDLLATNLEKDLDGTGYDLTIVDINASGTITASSLIADSATITTINSDSVVADFFSGNGYDITLPRPENTLEVIPGITQNITGKVYSTWASADAYISANKTPSRSDIWAIKISGLNTEDIIVREWVTIQGMASTILTGNVTFGGANYTYYNAYTIKDCILNNFTGGGLGTATGVLRRCEIRGGVSATVFCILADCWVVEWTSTTLLFTAYFFCSIYGVGAGVIMDPTTVMINGYITSATIQGGMFTGVDIDNNTWALSEDLEIRNCFLNDNLDMSTSSEAVIVSFLNSTIDNETITIGAGNTLFTGGDITGLTITEDGGTWLKGDGYFTDAFIYDDLSVVDDFDVDGETTLSNLSVSGNSIFNLSAYDKDFTINKETSDTAFKYDAGLDTIVISSNVGIGIASNASLLLLGAGTATSAPLQFTSGTLLDTPLPGTLEYDGCSLYMTNIATQRALDRTSDVAIATVTVANTTNETVLWTAVMPANSLCTGNVFKFHCDGIIENDGAAATEEVTLRIKVNGNTIATLNPTTRSLAAGSHWHIDANATQRTLGASGSRAVHIDLNIDDVLEEITAVATINTTLAMDVTVTAEWASADVNNTISLYQGFMEYKN